MARSDRLLSWGLKTANETRFVSQGFLILVLVCFDQLFYCFGECNLKVLALENILII